MGGTAVALCLACSVASAQGGRRAVRGAVLDSASGLPVAGAAVTLRGAGFERVTRSDESGAFVMSRVGAGTYALSVRRIGYHELTRELRFSDRDTTLSLTLRPLPERLPAMTVRERVTGIFGVVASATALRPIQGAAVRVLGAGRTVATDATGRFFVDVGKPGVYVVRVRRAGYADEVFSLDVPRDRLVEASRLLDSSSTAPAPGLDGFWDDFDQRARWRAMNSALVPGSQVRRYGGSLTDAIQGSAAVVSKGLRIGSEACLFINGIPRPGLPLDAVPVDDVEAVEVYGTRGDPTGILARQWPTGAPCTDTAIRPSRAAGPSPELARYVVVWLRR